MGRHVLSGAVVALTVAAAHPAAGADAAPIADRARSLLEALEDGSGDGRESAAAELAELGPPAVDALAAHLSRERRSSEAARRSVLADIGAAVPDEDGHFRDTPEGASELDWLPALFDVPDGPGVGELVADVAAVRALAATDAPGAAAAILDFAFTGDGMIVRDECGRYLRKMAPASLPALIRASETRKKHPSKGRYANYQLGRLDRLDAFKALNAAANEDLKVAVLDAYRETRDREAVYAVLATVDHVAPAVREAAREAWLAYVTGPPPPPAPERRLELPGGKLTDEPEPLYLTSRELAGIALRRTLADLPDVKPERRASLEELSNTLFAYYDTRRREQLQAAFDEAKKLAEGGELAAAVAEYDRILVQDPEFPQRSEMAPDYIARGEQLQEANEWREASTAYGKAHTLAADGPRADEALAAHHFTRGKALAAEGKKATGEYERTLELDPEHEGALAAGGVGGGRTWMLYGGIGAGALALVLGALGLVARRRHGAG